MDQPWKDYVGWGIQHVQNFSAVNLTALLFTIFVLCKPCRSPFFVGKCWRIICVTNHFLLHAIGLTFIITCATGYLDDYFHGSGMHAYGQGPCRIKMIETITVHHLEHLFRAIMFCYGAHFVLGLIVFSGLNVAQLITPILSAAVFALRKVASCCCSCRPDWLNAIDECLNELLLPEEEREVKMRREEKKEKDMMEMEMEKVKEVTKGELEGSEIQEMKKAKEETEGELEGLEMDVLNSGSGNDAPQLPEEERPAKEMIDGEERKEEL